MRWLLTLALLIATCATVPVLAGPAPQPPAKAPEKAPPPDLAELMKKLDAMDERIASLSRQLDSISRFLGDRQSSSMDTVDRRLRDLERAMDDLARDVQRLR